MSQNSILAHPAWQPPFSEVELGRGGMGAVYLAERADGGFSHRVAIKLIKRGMDTDHVLARFRAERQILASLDHPNIARLLDGAAPSMGSPTSRWSASTGSRSTSSSTPTLHFLAGRFGESRRTLDLIGRFPDNSLVLMTEVAHLL